MQRFLSANLIARQSTPHGVARRLGPVGRVGLVEDTSHVVAHGVDAYDKFLGDFSVGLACGDQANYLDLSLGQPVWVGRLADGLDVDSIL